MIAIGQRLTPSMRRFQRITLRGTYVPQIDRLHVLAIIPLMFWHAGIRGARMAQHGAPETALFWLSHGYVGVAFFLSISDYIIRYPFFAGRALSLGQFYIRHVYRLQPPSAGGGLRVVPRDGDTDRVRVLHSCRAAGMERDWALASRASAMSLGRDRSFEGVEMFDRATMARIPTLLLVSLQPILAYRARVGRAY